MKLKQTALGTITVFSMIAIAPPSLAQITAGIDFDFSSGATQPGFLSVPATNKKDYKVTHNGITFDINGTSTGANANRKRSGVIGKYPLFEDFIQWNSSNTGDKPEAAITLSGLNPNSKYSLSFGTYNSGAHQQAHHFYDGAVDPANLITTFKSSGRPNEPESFVPAAELSLNSDGNGKILVTIQASSVRLTFNGMSVVAGGKKSGLAHIPKKSTAGSGKRPLPTVTEQTTLYPADSLEKATVIPSHLPFPIILNTAFQGPNKPVPTHEEDEAIHAGYKGFGSVWFSWSSRSDQRVELEVKSTTASPILAVYTGHNIADLSLCNSYNEYASPCYSRQATDPLSEGARVEFQAKAGKKYFFAIDNERIHWGEFSLILRKSDNPLSPQLVLLPLGAKWEALYPVDTDGNPLDPETKDKDFDSTWMIPKKYDGPGFSPAAPSPIGWGKLQNSELRTSITGRRYRVPPKGQRHTCYFRTTFTPEWEMNSLGFEGLFSDGAIIYINGKEVSRMNVLKTSDARDWKTGSARPTRSDPDSPTGMVRYGIARDLQLPADKPVDLAVSLHNSSPDDLDLAMDLRVYAVSSKR